MVMLRRFLSTTSGTRGSDVTNSAASAFPKVPPTTVAAPLETAAKVGDYEYEDPKSEEEVVNITYVLRDGK
jgi:hypothetical protein